MMQLLGSITADKLLDFFTGILTALAMVLVGYFARKGKRQSQAEVALGEKQAEHEQAESDNIYQKMAFEMAAVNRELVISNSKMVENEADYRRQIAELKSELAKHAEQIKDLYTKLTAKDEELINLRVELADARAKLKECEESR